MSRIGKKPIEVPKGVSIEYKDRMLNVKGPLGSDTIDLLPGVDLNVDEKCLSIILKKEQTAEKAAALHGLTRALIANMIVGVSKGFEKELEIVGVGYRASQQKKDVVFQLGYSHNVTFTPPDGITVEVLEPTKLKVKGINKQAVGQVAANIRELRPPEPYKGKGIRYKDEYIRKKAGKAGKK